jgi:hypothetical protein
LLCFSLKSPPAPDVRVRGPSRLSSSPHLHLEIDALRKHLSESLHLLLLGDLSSLDQLCQFRLDRRIPSILEGFLVILLCGVVVLEENVGLTPSIEGFYPVSGRERVLGWSEGEDPGRVGDGEFGLRWGGLEGCKGDVGEQRVSPRFRDMVGVSYSNSCTTSPNPIS